MFRIKELRSETGLSMRQVAIALRIPYTTYISYEKGDREPNSEMLIKLADYFNCSVDYLIGRSNTKIDDSVLDKVNEIDNDLLEKYGNIYQAKKAQQKRDKNNLDSTVVVLPTENIYMRPLFNSVAAGFGVIADNTIVSYVPTYIGTPSEQEQYIWITVQGDSMAPLIDDGSKILIRKQDSVDSGQIGVVLVDGEEAVVKKINYGKDWIELVSINPYYPPRRFEKNDIQRIRVLGLVKEVSKELQ